MISLVMADGFPSGHNCVESDDGEDIYTKSSISATTDAASTARWYPFFIGCYIISHLTCPKNICFWYTQNSKSGTLKTLYLQHMKS